MIPTSPRGLARVLGAFVVVALLLLTDDLPPVVAQQGGIELPAGFYVRETIEGLLIPTDMAPLPDGNFLVAEKGVGADEYGVAAVRLVDGGVVREEPVLTLSVNPLGDSGLLSIEPDPGFADNGYFYLYYATGARAMNWSGETRYRLSRFTFNAESGRADAQSELVLIDELPWSIQHGGGGLRFDNSGMLYLAVGDVRDPHNSQTPLTPNGKVFRIRPTADGYDVPGDNPYLDDEDAIPELYAVGLRSPFRMTRLQRTGELFLGDVGAATWEEVNRIAPAANYGWPTREGPCPYGRRQPCDRAHRKYTDPFVYYEHPRSENEDEEIGSSVTGLAFYEGDGFPASYRNALFLADLNLGTISVARFPDEGFVVEPFASNVPNIVDLEYVDGALYYLVIGDGKIGVITHADVENRAPVARLSADIPGGAAPLTVRFDASASFDADGDTIEYLWDFDDGEEVLVSTSPLVTRAFAADANYDVRLQVVDSRGGASEAVVQPIVVYSGEVPRIDLTNVTEPARTLYHGGDEWLYSVERTTGLDGLDADIPFSWSIYLHHNQHSHPVLIGNNVYSDTLSIETDNHGGDWNLWRRLALTMKTDAGQEITVEREIFPAHIYLTTATMPFAGTVTVNGVTMPAPNRLKAIVGTEQQLSAPSTIVTRDGVGLFEHWYVHADGFPLQAAAGSTVIASAKITVSAPLTSTSYTAFYRFDRAADTIYLPVIARTSASID